MLNTEKACTHLEGALRQVGRPGPWLAPEFP